MLLLKKPEVVIPGLPRHLFVVLWLHMAATVSHGKNCVPRLDSIGLGLKLAST